MGYRQPFVLWIVLTLVAVFLLLLFQYEAPAPTEVAHTPASAVRDGVVLTNDKHGRLHTSITYANGVKHGPSQIYYPDGQVMLSMTYTDGKREGESVKYFEDGSVYAVTPYEDDGITGIRKVYYSTGQLKAEVPYYRSQPGTGLREYYQDGSPKELPQIGTQRENHPGFTRLLVRIDGCKEVRFYVGALYSNRYLMPDPAYVDNLPSADGEVFYYDVEQANARQSVNVICHCKTPAGFPYVVRKVVPLGGS